MAEDMAIDVKEKALEQLGLSKNESKVYLALLEYGLSTAGQIAEKTRIYRANTYDSINGLGKRGLVRHIEKGKIRYYEAANPDKLMDILKNKKEQFKKIIPELKLSRQLAPKKSEVHVYEGVEAFKNILDHFLDLRKERYVIGVPAVAHKIIGDFLKTYHNRRVELRMQIKEICNVEAEERAKFLNTLPYTEARCLTKEHDSPVSTIICGDEIVLTYWTEIPFFVHIIRKEIADAYKGYFELLWNKARKPE